LNLQLQARHLFQFILVAALVGYPVIAAAGASLDFDSSTLSLIFRATMAAAAAVLIVNAPRLRNLDTATLLFLVFWTAYFARLLYTFSISSERISEPESTFWMWSVGVCFLPSLALLLYRGQPDFAKASLFILILGIISIALILLFGSTSFETVRGQVADQNRWNLATLNPISIGHLGATVVLVSVGLLTTAKRDRKLVILLLAGCVTGSAAVLLANSRGPLVALVAALTMLFLARANRRETWLFGGVIALGGVTFIAQRSETLLSPGGLLDRFDSFFSGEDMSVGTRGELFNGAFDQFLSSPLVGDGLEVRSVGFYPHNVILEAFMTTGMIGDIPFLLLLGLSFRSAWRIFRWQPDRLWLGLVAVQYIVGGQFSGAIYQLGSMWVLIAALAFRDPISPALPRPGHRGVPQTRVRPIHRRGQGRPPFLDGSSLPRE
jgi:O-antigen ligase